MKKLPTIILPTGDVYDTSKKPKSPKLPMPTLLPMASLTLKFADSPSMLSASKYGLVMSHCLYRARDAQALADFYHKRTGMTILSKENERFVLGFEPAGGDGASWIKNGSQCYSPAHQVGLDVCQAEGGAAARFRQNGTFWKIGLAIKDVNHAVKTLSQHMVGLHAGAQFMDIGYVAHFQDPEGFVVELLQHQFEANFTRPASVIDDPRLPLGHPALVGQVTLRVIDIEDTLKFYVSVLGMKLLSRMKVAAYNFTLYFLAFTDETPPSDVDDLVAHREWLWQRPYSTLELQHFSAAERAPEPYKDLTEGEAGFLGLRVMLKKENIDDFTKHLKDNCVPVYKEEKTGKHVCRDPNNVPLEIETY